MVDIKLIKQLREETQVSIADCTKALEEAKGDYEKAIEILKKEESRGPRKKADRETAQGLIEAYIHQNGKWECFWKFCVRRILSPEPKTSNA